MHQSNYDISIDYFAILGVHYNACEKTVKLAYRKMARRYHPDVSKIHNATEKFQEVSEAYEVLSRFRDSYCRDYNLSSRQRHQRSSSTKTQSNSDKEKKYARYTQKTIDGKNRQITYPLTLRYAIRLLKIGFFYIPGLKVKMKFTREAFTGRVFRLKGKGYMGLFGGESGDFLVSFSIKLDGLRWTLKEADLYGTISVAEILLRIGSTLDLDSPSGLISVTVPLNYAAETYIKIDNMGLPADADNRAGHLYLKLKSLS